MTLQFLGRSKSLNGGGINALRTCSKTSLQKQSWTRLEELWRATWMLIILQGAGKFFLLFWICFGLNRFRLSELDQVARVPANLKEVTAAANSSSQSCRAKFTLKFTLKSHNQPKTTQVLPRISGAGQQCEPSGNAKYSFSSKFPKRLYHRTVAYRLIWFECHEFATYGIATSGSAFPPLLKPSARRKFAFRCP